jgi:pimeloyl-ACP methyl ester carboxylesterase
MTTIAVPTTRTFRVPGVVPVELTVTEQGDGQPFVLLHGGAGPQSFGRFGQLLAGQGGNRVVTPTHPGFGGTHRPDGLDSVAGLAAAYLWLIDELGLEDVTLIGNSLGGWIAVEMALLGSARIGGLVLLDAVGIEVEGHAIADVAKLSLPEIQSLSFHDPAPFRVDPATIPDAQKKIMGGNAAALAVYAGTTAMADPTLLGRLSAIAIPALVLWGDSDRIADVAYGRALAGAIHGARLQVLSGTGHMPQLETPELVLNAIAQSADIPYRGDDRA